MDVQREHGKGRRQERAATRWDALLPNETLIHIFEGLYDLIDLLSLRCASRRFRGLAEIVLTDRLEDLVQMSHGRKKAMDQSVVELERDKGPRMSHYRTFLTGLSHQEVNELRFMRDPPHEVRVVCGCISILFGGLHHALPPSSSSSAPPSTHPTATPGAGPSSGVLTPPSSPSPHSHSHLTPSPPHYPHPPSPPYTPSPSPPSSPAHSQSHSHSTHSSTTTPAPLEQSPAQEEAAIVMSLEWPEVRKRMRSQAFKSWLVGLDRGVDRVSVANVRPVEK
ncbi:hypothetical protein M427DRAFT_359896 [Gonapodya prolifera JEL478]|uniref:F-box domain-containing protein n=1 Tax=Gonapodya prolifera (strain JEL478) TaxID=1344416 RepID=A0A139AAR8_GONPJ|nr:hypothetical protein M427DRAFT_359896 [Gonapodya prolifera JEL478]|eukprot:KXS13921.1 hypothetical protein M427DRAFT_359896 [Gonapodya prolifera JEL478]